MSISSLPGISGALYSVVAPGVNVLSIVKAPENDTYVATSGSRESAALATGALALVEQKYPFLNARQLIDTILTTANRDFIVPDYIVSFKNIEHTFVDSVSKDDNGNVVADLSAEDFNLALDFNPELFKELELRETQGNRKNKELSGTGPIFNLFIEPKVGYFVFRVLNPEMKLPETTKEAKQLLTKYLNLNPVEYLDLNPVAYQGSDKKQVIDYLVNNNAWHAERVNFEEVFGQGILDVGKAVNGVARLDANRLRRSDVNKTYHAVLDTFELPKDKVAWFDNDISERRWDDNYHAGELRTYGKRGKRAKALADLPVGLRKSGAGSLGLRGHNTFTGPIVVASGTLMLEPRLDGTGGIVESKVIVKKGATFKGEGKVNELSNSGTVKIDFALKLNKFVQKASGTLHLIASGDNWGMRVKEADISGSLILKSESRKYPDPASVATLAFIPEANKEVRGRFNNVKVYSNAQFKELRLDDANDAIWQFNSSKPHGSHMSSSTASTALPVYQNGVAPAANATINN